MESQIKYYLHIQHIKKLKSEIDIINKHKNEYKIQKNFDYMQQIIYRENIILNIIGLYDIMEYYYCTGRIESLKKFIKMKEEQINAYFQLRELDKFYMMIHQPKN